MTPAIAMTASRIRITIAVAGRTGRRSYPDLRSSRVGGTPVCARSADKSLGAKVSGPPDEGPDYM